MKNVLFINKLKYFILIIFSLLIVFSFHPSIMRTDEYTGNIINPFSKYIMIVFTILFIINIKKIKLAIKCSFIRIYMLIMLMILVYAIITILFVNNKFILGEARSLIICLIAIIIGFTINISDIQLSKLIIIFAISGFIVGISIVITNIGSFTIIENSNITYKNAIGVVLSTASIVSFYVSFNKKYIKLYRIFLLIISIVLLTSILTIRARAAGLSTIITLVAILYLKNKNKNKNENIIALLTTIILVILLIIILPQNIKDFVIDSFFKGFEGKDITSDRARRNQEALLFLKNNIFIGNMNQHTYVDQIHNYPLRILFNGGIIFSFPILLLYTYLLSKSITYTFKINFTDLKNIGFITILIPFGISMLEPTLPFGPGTTTTFNFLLLGISLRNNYELNKKI